MSLGALAFASGLFAAVDSSDASSQDPAISRFAENDEILVTIATANGAAASAAVLERLRAAVERNIENGKSGNPPSDPNRQFLVRIRLKTYGKANPVISGSRTLELDVDVRLLPGGERVCYFIVQALVGPGSSEADLDLQAAASVGRLLGNPRMWISPELVLAPEDEAKLQPASGAP